MQRARNILFNSTLFLNSLLLFLLVFYSRITVPAWVQVLGRMHPLVLHFPVVLLLLYIVWQLWLSKKPVSVESKNIASLLLVTAAFAAAATALFGLLLSREEGYDADALAWHKYTGVALSFLAFAWAMFDEKITVKKPVAVIMAVCAFVLVLVTGDLGAGITHGENYLLAPVMPKETKPVVALEDAVVYTHMVQPIFDAKCIGCHNSKKAKGELIMETTAQLLKGGKDGALWDSANVDASLLLKRIHLPEEDEKHMPPQGKPQLTQEETNILYYWLKSGANFTAKVTDLQETDSLRMLALALFKPSVEEVYDFAAADEAAIKELSNNNRVIVPLAIGSPALAVDFYNSQNYTSQALKDLLKLKEQLVSVNLANMPVTDDDMGILAQFINLRKLNLNFSKISGKQLDKLSTLQHLKELSLSGTAVTLEDLQPLASVKSLRNVFAWNTAITGAKAKQVKTTYTLQTGFFSDTVVMKLTPPSLQNEVQVITAATPIQLKHYINGVTIRYTLDGSEPDSLNSPVYDKTSVVNTTALVKAKAYKPGWISSDVMQAWFYKSAYTPDSVTLFTQGDALYKGDGGKTLADHVKGDLNFKTNMWLGFNGKPMEAMLIFKQPVKAKSVTVSSLLDAGAYIMPPQAIEVWGGNDPGKLTLLGTVIPKQPTKGEPGALTGYNCSFPETELQYVRVKVKPLPALPAWHPGKGSKAWFFTDEIFVN
ncbi:chitobiase/beta-hexosaminidase C-terminal domain-containing protein [Panacibacter sp. DH6]|uniref:Chitobiase/beta-hexosaminidase C-terminal domain-containing protein n=1 Tax=Panacibacter microcysteis TaxID=2793269 RepID=A0A931E5C4_9BACT|nr:c-type cytochrome domain-containing protein [Panacibacter microcysteis]MBG9375801.1 chitobiase/beta-hexosaminidase C-terminal domain-containing protein [Panacibacter microcysteis]